jgi:5-methyltetrahydrofolate--homocysteine methyltransferase
MGKILEKIAEGKTMVSDGAWGTFLHQKGLKVDECPESWNLSRPEDVREIAQSYVDAGADLILTNSFGGSRHKLEGYGLQDQVYELNKAAAEISKKAAGDRALVLGSIGPTGIMVMMGEVPPQEIFKGFMEQARGLADGGVDGIVVETMADPEEARLAIEAVKKVCELDVACTFTFSKTQTGEYRTMMGTGVEEFLEMALSAGADIPILVHANAGLPQYRDGQTVFPELPGEMAPQMKDLVAAGANMVGGCCGTTPEHIRQIVAQLSP